MTEVIIADDLTGACDTAAMFVRGGMGATVLLPPLPPTLPETDIVAITTETRESGPEEAAARTRDITRYLTARGYRAFYKKIDSVLRGNIGVELAAMLAEGDYPFALVAPSFPEMGRTLERGRLFVHGVEGVSLAERLAGEGVTGIALLEASTDAAILTERISGSLRQGKRVLIADAQIPSHLAALAEACRNVARPLYVGSAGLASQLAAGMKPTFGVVAGRMPTAGKGFGILYAIGTPHPVTQAQVGTLLMDRTILRYRSATDSPKTAGEAIRSGRDVLLPLFEQESAGAISNALAEIVSQGPVGGLILSGGETAARQLERLGIHNISLGGEISTGFPWGVAVLPDGKPLLVAMKSGGFGAPETLRYAGTFLRESLLITALSGCEYTPLPSPR